VPANWLSIRVELVEGHGTRLWPRPGRIFAAARSHTFAQFATAIDDAFARWDRAHLHQFWLADGYRVGVPDDDDDDPDSLLDDRRTRLGRLKGGEQFGYEFDVGDSWLHLCTVDPQHIDPEETLGIVAPRPSPYWGWGSIPDQYGRQSDDDTDDRRSAGPESADLPRIGPWEFRP
jgi:hypothetical protein